MDEEMDWKRVDITPNSDLDDDGAPICRSDKEVFVSYWKGMTQKPFEMWLNTHLPSSIIKEEDGIDWISVTGETREQALNKFFEMDLEGLMNSWEQLKSSGRPINLQTVKELAINHRVLTGKWMFWAESGGKIDHLWSVVARNVIQGELGCICSSAKVSTSKLSGSPSHVVCIYNSNWTDNDQVLQAEIAIRNTGLKCKLLYKPDVYTYLDIYAGNDWGIRPVIMQSLFDVGKCVSVIENL